MMFPTLHTVSHTTRTETGENALGQSVVSETTVQRGVYGWSPRSTTDGDSAATANRVITEVSLLTPDADWRNGDIVVLPDGRQFIVRGDPEDMNAGPFGFQPGYKVTLRRVHDERS